MSEKTSSKSTGIGVGGLLGILFVALKLCGVIDWSWWWVTAPFWIPVAIIAAVFLVIGLIAVVVNKAS
jgi:hypothetical protein